jgi:hypothetical protein
MLLFAQIRTRLNRSSLDSSRVLALALTLAMWPSNAMAHPGWGLVRDSVRGFVYYTDLTRIWRIEGNGRRTAVLRDVHTHELMIDSVGNLYGEDSEFLGGDRWRYKVWKLPPGGRVVDVIPWTDGFRDDYGFVRDASGVLYWAKCSAGDSCTVRYRDHRGHVGTAGGGANFGKPLNFLAAAPGGGILVADGRDLKRITPSGGLEMFARGVSRADGRFAMMGMHLAADGSLYVAAFEDREIIRRRANGAMDVVARSDGPWKPSGVLVAPDGYWVMEYDSARVRVRNIRRSGIVAVYGPDA